MLEVCERRVAGAEVVDRDGEAFVAQPVQHLANSVDVMHEARFGDFELDPRRFAAFGANDFRYPLRQVVAIKLFRR